MNAHHEGSCAENSEHGGERCGDPQEDETDDGHAGIQVLRRNGPASNLDGLGDCNKYRRRARRQYWLCTEES